MVSINSVKSCATGHLHMKLHRVVEGLGEGVTFPAMLAILARWATPQERSRWVHARQGACMARIPTDPVFLRLE